MSAVSLLPSAARPDAAAAASPQQLAQVWDAEHVSPALPPLMDHEEVQRRLKAVAAADPNRYFLDTVGTSIEGRSIDMITTGRGPFRVLLWSQMHGDEPTATAALFDVFSYFQRHPDDPAVRRILSSLTLYVVPMLNPDGAERFQRRNAQGIDVNRDALSLQSPEGQVLKAVRDRFNPRIGFNLHNQSWSTTVGDPPQPASISLLSVAYDKEQSENAGRRMTKKVCAVIRDALEPFASGQIGRYDDDFEVRAFGDNLTLWGTPVVLIETGPYPSAEPDAPLVRMNFVAIVSALDALASGSRRQGRSKALRVAAEERVEGLLHSRQERDDSDGDGRQALQGRHRHQRKPAHTHGRRPARAVHADEHQRPRRSADVPRHSHDRRDAAHRRASMGSEPRAGAGGRPA